GAAQRPTGSVDDVGLRGDALTCAGGAHPRPDGLRHPAPATDDTAHVVGRDVQAQRDRVVAPALVDLDHHRRGVLDDRLREIVEHVARDRPDDTVAVVAVVVEVVVTVVVEVSVGVGHDVPGVLNWSHAPEIFNSFSTTSVGCAPFASQPTALSLSMLTTEGSARG